MKFFVFIFIFITACSPPSLHTGSPAEQLEITEIDPDKWTVLTKQNIFHLAQVYDLSPLLFTRKIQIDAKATFRSHPILTVNTKYAENPHKLLAKILHEQMLWWLNSKPKEAARGIKELKNFYFKSSQQKTSQKNDRYLQLMACYLEYRALSFYLGNKHSVKIIKDFILEDKLNSWSYTQILLQHSPVKKIVEKLALTPGILR